MTSQTVFATSNPEFSNISTNLELLAEKVSVLIDVASTKSPGMSGSRLDLGDLAIRQIMEENAKNSAKAREIETEKARGDLVGSLMDKGKGDHQYLNQGGELLMQLLGKR